MIIWNTPKQDYIETLRIDKSFTKDKALNMINELLEKINWRDQDVYKMEQTENIDELHIELERLREQFYNVNNCLND